MEEFTADNLSAPNETQGAGMDGGAAAQNDAGEMKKSAGSASLNTENNEDVSRTKIFSQRLNEMSEKKAKETESAVRREFEGHEKVLEALKSRGYEGSAEDIADALTSEMQKTQAGREADVSRTVQDHPYLLWARDIIDDRTFEQDLSAVKAAYPEVKESSVWELGDVYIRLMASGAVDAVTAYEAQRAYNSRQSRPAPPSIGPAASGGLKPEKEFYTPEEVDRLSKEDYDNPKIMQRVRKSMTMWK